MGHTSIPKRTICVYPQSELTVGEGEGSVLLFSDLQPKRCPSAMGMDDTAFQKFIL